jgi:hypothetical protein
VLSIGALTAAVMNMLRDAGDSKVEGDLSIGQLATIGSRTIGDFKKPLKALKYE